MSEFTTQVYDYGICEFCGQPIEFHDNYLHIRRIEEYGSRVAHEMCWNGHLEEEEEE